MQVTGIMLGCRCEVVLHETNPQPPAGGQLVSQSRLTVCHHSALWQYTDSAYLC